MVTRSGITPVTAFADRKKALAAASDLSTLDFKRANLSRANLFGAKLVAADFSGANLSGAKLDLQDNGFKFKAHCQRDGEPLLLVPTAGWTARYALSV